MKDTTRSTLLNAIEATPVARNTVPVAYVIAELRQFQQQLSVEPARFTAKGLSTEFLQLGNAIADELQRRETTWSNQRFTTPETQALAREAAELRHDLLDDLELGLLNNPTGLQTLNAIRDHHTTENMLFDLKRLIELARAHWPDMQIVGMTEPHLQEVEAFYQRYSTTFAHQKEQQREINALKQRRNQAKTFAVNYCALIRRYVQTIYRNEPEKKALYISTYYRNQTKKDLARRKADRTSSAETTNTPD